MDCASSSAALLARLSRALGVLGGGVLFVLLALVAAGTVLRYAGLGAIPGAAEVEVGLYVLLVFAGFPLMPMGALSMRLDFAARRLPARLRPAAASAADGIALAAALVLASGAARVALLIGGRTPELAVPEWVRFAPVAAAGGLGALAIVLNVLAERRGAASLALTLALGIGLFLLSRLPPPVRIAAPSLAAGAVAVVALGLGAPLPHALLAGLALAQPFGARLPEAAIVQNAVAGAGKILLLAIPFFLLTGILMNAGGMARRLIALAAALVGHLRGGLAQTTLLTNLMFAGISGSSVADAAFGTKVLAPALVGAGYPPARAAAVTAATAILPNVVPPSIAFLILAVVANLSVGSLFAGGLAAGLVLALALAVVLHLSVPAAPVRAPATARDRAAAARRALPAIGLAALVFFGIRLGFATPTEAAALAACYVLATFPGDRDRPGPRGIARAFARAGRETGAIGILIGSAAPFVFLLAVDGLPRQVERLLSALGGGAGTVTLASCLLLLAAGCVLDIAAGILLFAPLLLPAAVAAGIDPIRFGVVVVVALMIGGLTPPVGMLVYVVSGVAGVPSAEVFRAVRPLTLTLVAALAAIAAFAALTAS